MEMVSFCKTELTTLKRAGTRLGLPALQARTTPEWLASAVAAWAVRQREV